METIFCYKARASLENTHYRLWYVAVTDRVLRVGAALLYEEYRMCWLSTDIIRLTLQLGMVICPHLVSNRNVHEALELLEVI